MTYSRKDLEIRGAEPLARWLIEAALSGGTLTYSDAKFRLEAEYGFSTIFSTHMGAPAGRLMEEIHRVAPDAPLLNVILVRQKDGMPGDGAGYFMAKRFNNNRLTVKGVRESHPRLWRKYFEKAADEVYAFSNWRDLFKKVYGSPLVSEIGSHSPFDPNAGTEEDGHRLGGGGEGRNHRLLRLWVRDNPGALISSSKVRTETEVFLKSADRVDVVYFLKGETIAIEVKSADSNEIDLQRGIFQCIKYQAVMKAMDPRESSKVSSLLVTESSLPKHLRDLAARLGVRHKQVPSNEAR